MLDDLRFAPTVPITRRISHLRAAFDQTVVQEVDRLNRLCYDMIAREYDDHSHATCRDFEVFTEKFLTSAVEFVSDSKRDIRPTSYIDIGVGTGLSLRNLQNYLGGSNVDIDVLDISNEMLGVARGRYGRWIRNYHWRSIHDFLPSHTYDLAVATMCDPFLTPLALERMANLVRGGGLLILTYPHPRWAALAHPTDPTGITFRDNTGKICPSYSFCWAPREVERFLSRFGLRVLIKEEFSLGQSGFNSSLNARLIADAAQPIPFYIGIMLQKSDGTSGGLS